LRCVLNKVRQHFELNPDESYWCAPRPLPSVAGAKTKNFPYLSSFPRRGCGGSRQKMERKFLVLLRLFRLRN